MLIIAICTVLAVVLAFLFLQRKVKNSPISEPVINKPRGGGIGKRMRSGIFATTKHEIDLISKAIDGCFIFSGIGIKDKEDLINAFEKDIVEEGRMIITQGDTAKYFYIIQSGIVNFYVNEQQVGNRSDGESFGDLALLDDSKRNASCISHGEGGCILWRLHKDDRLQIMSRNTTKSNEVTVEMLKNVPPLRNLSDSVLNRVASKMKETKIPKDAVIFKKGDIGRESFILKSGSVRIEDIQAKGQNFATVTINPGWYFGERAMLENEPRAGTAVANSECTLLCISREVFENNVGSIKDIRRKANFARLLKSIPCFTYSDISNTEYTILISRTKVITVQSDTILYSGSNKNIYLIEEGEVTVSRDGSEKEKRSIQTHFGENSFLEEESLITETVTANKKTVLGVLSLDSIEIVIRNTRRLKKAGSVPEEFEPLLAIDELFRHKVLGMGAFGKVWLVSPMKGEKIIKNQVYALKIQQKRCLLDNKMSAGVIREAAIMKSLDHPFLGNILNVHHNKGAVYFLMNFIQGGELYDLIQEDGVGKPLPSENARFYAACVLLALDHMHLRNHLYRDLKPENIMIGSDGYPVLIDFGFSRKISDGGLAFTICGSPYYIAPEVILGKGHNQSFDHWAWAILIHELLIGDVPFSDRVKTTPIKVYKAIVKGKIKLSPLLGNEVKDMLKQIVVHDPYSRLGSLAGGCIDIKNHSWFEGLDFDAVGKKQVVVPWRPHINKENPLDSAHFGDHSHTELEPDYDDLDFLTDKEQMLFSGLNDLTSNPEEEKGNG